MIPKKIHYCWFGRNPKNTLIRKCMDSWKKHLPDYEIIEWNEDNFDVQSVRYVREAYEAKKWAFVSDYVRLWALKEYGGIYLDTDVEVFKGFDRFLEHGFFSGFENYNDKGNLYPITAVMGSVRDFWLLSTVINGYHGRPFIGEDGKYDLTTNTKTISEILTSQVGIDSEKDIYQHKKNIHIYPSNTFCIYKGDETYSVHHFNGSWLPFYVHLNNKIQNSENIPSLVKRISDKVTWSIRKFQSI